MAWFDPVAWIIQKASPLFSYNSLSFLSSLSFVCVCVCLFVKLSENVWYFLLFYFGGDGVGGSLHSSKAIKMDKLWVAAVGSVLTQRGVLFYVVSCCCCCCCCCWVWITVMSFEMQSSLMLVIVTYLCLFVCVCVKQPSISWVEIGAKNSLLLVGSVEFDYCFERSKWIFRRAPSLFAFSIPYLQSKHVWCWGQTHKHTHKQTNKDKWQ